jgi:hypothetical protein
MVAVAEDAIAATASLQRERALAGTLDEPSLLLTHAQYQTAIDATDEAMEHLRTSWAEHRDQVPATATPTIGDVLVAEVSLEEFREATLSAPSGEPTFDLYDEIVALSAAATSELVKQASDFATLTDRRLVVALLELSTDLHTRRHLVQETLATGPPVPEEVVLQLDVVMDAINQGFVSARSRAVEAADDDAASSTAVAIEGLRTGPLAELTAGMVAEVQAASGSELEVDPRQWFAATTARIEQVEALLPDVMQRISLVATAERVRANRALWTNSLLLGSLFLVSTLRRRTPSSPPGRDARR